MTTKVMLDLETLGRSAGCKILAIGAVEFDTTMGLGRDFCAKLKSLYPIVAISHQGIIRHALHAAQAQAEHAVRIMQRTATKQEFLL